MAGARRRRREIQFELADPEEQMSSISYHFE